MENGLPRRRLFCVGDIWITICIFMRLIQKWLKIGGASCNITFCHWLFHLQLFEFFYFLKDIEMSNSNFELFKFANVSKVQWQLLTNNENYSNDTSINVNMKNLSKPVDDHCAPKIYNNRMSKYVDHRGFILFCQQRA